ncbi:hypothetical protein CEUSTIGMA_g11477.t1 [Chlamydomonas eustigma]|uniref:CBM20 domain-containing protein n=1 Tax=Chlamydomonas eustigma TaxID=1157962 RepID=A0A250XLZ4_9CHLO|nr:hypothetical protein CEUSTIGMA_g11477.t1 [Chlamydomonas eustigma]|eukprot:GAX84053.1 hypothetical protein CEUSTIGMA_g11477.t1 [Chlamydomonas eustigma]
MTYSYRLKTATTSATMNSAQRFTLVRSRGIIKVASSKYRPIRCLKTQEAATSIANVTIHVPLHTEFGQSVAVAGLTGSWKPEAALTLNWTKGDIWTGEFRLPTGSALECKYIVRNDSLSDDAVYWQAGENLLLLIPHEAHAAEVILSSHEVSVVVKTSTPTQSPTSNSQLNDLATAASAEATEEVLDVQLIAKEVLDMQPTTEDVPAAIVISSSSVLEDDDANLEVKLITDPPIHKSPEEFKTLPEGSVVQQAALDTIVHDAVNSVAEELEAYASGSSNIVSADSNFETRPAITSSKKTKAARKS